MPSEHRYSSVEGCADSYREAAQQLHEGPATGGYRGSSCAALTIESWEANCADGDVLPPFDHSDWKSQTNFVLIFSAMAAATFFASAKGTEHSLLKVFSKKSCMDWCMSGSW